VRIGVPRETKEGEARVGLVPRDVAMLAADGHQARVQSGAGARIALDDDAYRAAGARIRLIGDGDLSAGISAAVVGTGVHAVMGTGGASL